jgi:ABC-type bacteriocin/lantibiotic exporter with double-glycine peptidase domain
MSVVLNGQQLQIVQSHLERIADVLDAEPEQDPQNVQHPPRLTGQIRLEQVSFQYDANNPHAPKILKDITLPIEPGQKVAIVGKTGSGKSTLGKLLLGLCLPTTGEIFYDDIPLRNLNYQEVRAQFGVVMQDANIFSGTIGQNITFNNPAISKEDMIAAAQAAAFDQDIANMPMKYETFVAEGGSAISGGQRQRLAIARALAHKPAILLLDEATSALDVETEHTVEQNLNALSCTQIIIAHRLSTIRNADLILVLDEGHLIESGTHQQLLAQHGYYARLIQHQLATDNSNTIRSESLQSFLS